MIKLLLFDHQALTREGIKAILTGYPEITVVCETVAENKVVALINRVKPDVLLINYRRGVTADADLLIKIYRRFSLIKILVLSDAMPKQDINDLMSIGIINYVDKACSIDDLLNAIITTARGEPFLCKHNSHTLSENSEVIIAPAYSPTLTAREIEIIQMVSGGLTNKEIAEKLFLSFHTIKTHRKNIIKKLGFNFKNSSELASVIKSLLQ